MADYNPTPYGQACRKDIPYPSVSNESVPSLIDNLVTALYGSITKTVINKRVVWNIPCDPANTPSTILGVPRNPGEGLLCYIIRVFNTPSSIQYTGNFFGTFQGQLIGGVAGSLVYQSAKDTTSFLPPGTAGQILTATGNGLQWTSTSSTNIANNIAAGAAGQIPYQAGVSTTRFSPVGTVGQVLQSNGGSAPSWLSTAITNTANTLVLRDNNGNFSANQITAALKGNADTATTAYGVANGAVTPAGLSTGGPSWDASGNLNISGNITGNGATQIVQTSLTYALIFG